MIDEHGLDNLKAMINIVDVVGETVKLKRKGADYVGLCPFHAEKTPSFTVSPSKQVCKCFGCGKGGDAIWFIEESQQISFIEAIKVLAAKYHIDVEITTPVEYTKPTERLQKVSDKILKFFESRGISNNTLLRFGITESTEFMPQTGQEEPVICFNYYREGQLVNIKFRGPKKTFKLEKGAELIFYNLDAVKDSSTVYIVEGEMDALALYEADVYNVISVPNGAGAKNQNLTYLDNCIKSFENKEEIILITDNDEPGRALRYELARRLGFNRCRMVQFPSGIKDANECLMKHGKDELKRVCTDLIEFPIEGVVSVFDMVDQVVDFYDNGYPHGYYVPLEGFKDNIDLQLMLGQFGAVTGIPGSGKSEFIDWLMVKMSIVHGWVWGIFSPENQPESIHATKLLEKFTGKSFAHRKDVSQRMTRDELSNGLYFLHQHFHFIKVGEDSQTLEGVLDKVSDLILQKGIKGFLIDPWNKLEIGSAASETIAVNRALSKTSMFCKTKMVHGIIIAHPTKIPKIAGTKKYEVPTMYNISGSANWYNQIDWGGVVYRDRDEEVVTFYLQKLRFSWLGKEGQSSYRYNTYTRQYESIDSSVPPTGPPGFTPLEPQLFINEPPPF